MPSFCRISSQFAVAILFSSLVTPVIGQESTTPTSGPTEKTPMVQPVTRSREGADPSLVRKKNTKEITGRSVDGQVQKRQVDVPEPTVVLKPGEVPEIKFDTPVYDFGRVKAGPDVSHEYWFTNTGTGPLEILSVKPSCGCTTAGQFDRIVQPGATGKIPVKISTAKAADKLSKSITVHTNVAGTNSSIQLQLKGEIWRDLQVVPQSASFGRTTVDDINRGKALKLKIVKNLEGKIKLGEPTCPSRAFQATLAMIKENKEFELTVSMTSEYQMGSNSAVIEIPTDDPETPTVEVSAYGFVTQAIDVSPEQLVLPDGPNLGLQRQFYIRCNETAFVKVSNPVSPDPAIKLDLSEVRPGKVYLLKADVAPGYKPSKGHKITLKTDHTKAPQITIPVVPNSLAMPPTSPVRGKTPQTARMGARGQQPVGAKGGASEGGR